MGTDLVVVERRPTSWNHHGLRLKALLGTIVAILICLSWANLGRGNDDEPGILPYRSLSHSPYGRFPIPNDPFHFLPCTNTTIPPPLEDPHPERTWGRLFDPDPDHWSWGNKSTTTATTTGSNTAVQAAFTTSKRQDPYDGRGIYMCGYLDVPLDYTNASDSRIVRLAITKFQVSGLAFDDGTSAGTTAAAAEDGSAPGPGPGPGPRGRKSKRTIVIEPGGPGGSGTSFAWREAENISKRLSDGTFDVLGWDPRGVNATRPAVSCFPYDADRDRWRLLATPFLEASGPGPGPGPGQRSQLELADAMNEAIFGACWARHGDLGRFVSTAFVARDLERIRAALALGGGGGGEDDDDELTGYLVSYGTGIGQTYANMFPDRVGRLVLDGTEYVRDHRLLGGFGWTALDNGTDAWNDGFLGECVRAGPAHCALAQPSTKNTAGDDSVSVGELQARMRSLLASLLARPIPAYTEASGPSLVTYPAVVSFIYGALYNAQTWPRLAQILRGLEQGNATLAAAALEEAAWEYDPTKPFPKAKAKASSSDELERLVICSDSYDAPQPEDGLDWWLALWANMTAKSWVAGNDRFHAVFPCRHFAAYWPEPAEVYRGDLNRTLRHPVLLIAETYDPATPLRNGRRLLGEMGANARLVVHHGYGHSSRDRSNCTDSIARDFVLRGVLPEGPETDCFANEKPYLYGVKKGERDDVGTAGLPVERPVTVPQDTEQLPEAEALPDVEL
ncbi:hypothetical protein SLS62_001830 [Diatrype stigma]|uniref:Peptidase S33 tripeptidyl aminopeptidase-like C-terminal domain-containing protein n=1 Tax=Diatrype stigma TaxID=117547 RepID=A0AAN9UYH3_9PEZI